jgi:YD repeat-containing protein
MTMLVPTLRRLIAVLIAAAMAPLTPLAPAHAGTVTYTYDPAGRLVGADADDGSSLRYTYDLAGNLLRREVSAPLPRLTMVVNDADLRPGQTITLTAVLVPGTTPAPVDAYVVVQLPGGALLSVTLAGSVVPGIVPIATGFVPFPFSGPLLAYTFTGLEPPGAYTVFVALTQPGTLNVIGVLQQTPLTFTP